MGDDVHSYEQNLSYFELSQARTWAMYSLHLIPRSRFVIDLPVESVESVESVDAAASSSSWFLVHDIPQYHGGVKLADWTGKRNSHGTQLVFTRDDVGDDVDACLYVRAFRRYNSLYVGLYKENGAIFAPVCLVIWNRDAPEVTNQGYSGGRCPDVFPGAAT